MVYPMGMKTYVACSAQTAAYIADCDEGGFIWTRNFERARHFNGKEEAKTLLNSQFGPFIEEGRMWFVSSGY